MIKRSCLRCLYIMKAKDTMLSALFSLCAVGVYYFVYFKAQSLIQNLLANAAVYGARIKGDAYPVYLFGCIGIGDVRASVIVSAVAADIAVCWIYAPTRMEIGILQIYELFCKCKFAFIRVLLSVATEKRCCPFFGSLMDLEQ